MIYFVKAMKQMTVLFRLRLRIYIAERKLFVFNNILESLMKNIQFDHTNKNALSQERLTGLTLEQLCKIIILDSAIGDWIQKTNV